MEIHSKAEYVVAHGSSTTIEGKCAVTGSRHFVFEDEKCVVPEGKEKLFDALTKEYSYLYLAIEGSLACISIRTSKVLEIPYGYYIMMSTG